MRFVCLLLGLSVGLGAAGVPLMPVPQNIRTGEGRLPVDGSFRIVASGKVSGRAQRAMERAARRIVVKTGVLRNPDATATGLSVSHKREASQYPRLGEDESYRLTVMPAGARLEAETDLGVLRGLETAIQLVTADEQGWFLPSAAIEDAPRFPWRGLLLDVARHWMPTDTVKRTIDTMTAVKLNVLHLHLTDDQGFRLESTVHPKLHQMGSDGLYFTHEQVREIVDYAADRGVRVMPEIEMPGHATSWFAGYPELAAQPGPYTIERQWGVMDPLLDPTKEEVYRFLDPLIAEISGLFPDEFFHIGGDEVNAKQWNASAAVADFKKKHGLKDAHDVQVRFNQRVLQMVKKNGKTMVGWDEVLHPNLPTETVIQSWRGQKSLADAARRGYRGLLSNGYYIDLVYPAVDHYKTEPLSGDAASLTPEQQKLILGGEACMWSEIITEENVDVRLWPRTAAVAERLWSPQTITDVDSMYRRLKFVSRELEHAGATHRKTYRRMLERMAQGSDIEPLRTLADVVEPVKEYTRSSTGKYRSYTPLNRLVDTARPESDVAREFGTLVKRYLGRRSPEDAAAMRAALTEWRDNHARLQPMLTRSHLLAEVSPVSEALTAAARIGLDALDAIERRQAKPKGWAAGTLQSAGEAKAEVLLMIVPHVQRLSEAASQ